MKEHYKYQWNSFVNLSYLTEQLYYLTGNSNSGIEDY